MGSAEPERALLLERAEELAAIDAVVGDALAGAGRFGAIEGPAGIGKSSLLAEGRTGAVDAGMLVLSARGTEIERAFSFGVVRQLFESVLAQADPEERAKALDGAAGHAGRLFDPARFLDDSPASQDAAFALLHGLYWLTLNLAESRPVLIAIDDLQWADEPTLRWVAYLVHRLDGVSVGVLATVRPLPEEDPVLADLLTDSATTVIRPNALSPAAVAEVIRAQLSSEAEEEFCLVCHGTTGGNPLLLHELLRTLVSERVSPSIASVETVERLAPDAVARSVRLRLSRLPDATTALAHAIAILGDGADGAHAAALAGIERRELAPAAAALARVDLLRPEPPLRFVHPVVRNAVYESRGAHERANEHARAAGLLAAAGASAEQIAGQILLAPPESVEGATTWLRDAGRRAAAEGAESAADYFRRALEEALTDEERGEVLLELAAAEVRVGSPAVVEHLREAVTRIVDPERRARARLELGSALYWAGHEEEGVRVLEQALAERESADDDLQRRLEAELFANASRLPSGYEHVRQRLAAIRVRPEDGPGSRLLLSIQAYHQGASGTGSCTDAADRAERALSAMDPDERAWNYTTGIYTLLHTDRLETALRFLNEAIRDVSQHSAVFRFSSLSMTRSIIQYARGSLNEAEADARIAIGALPHGDVWFVPHAYGWLAQILVERGAVEEAATLLEAIEAASDPFSQTPLHRSRAMVAAAQGEHRAAVDHALALGRDLAAFGHDNPPASYPAWRSLAALAHHALGENDEARALAREEVELARAWGAPRTLGRSLRIFGLIQGGEEGMGLITEAVDVLARTPARLEHAYALADLGAALRRGNRRAQARDRLREALELAQRIGAILLGERAHEELVATGARPRRLVLTGVDALTPSERRVAAMAAEGLSNREIAQALFVTLRTVEMHLSNVFRKLGIATRTQIPAALASSATPTVAAGT